MSIRIVRLGTPRLPDEGLRIGTVRRPPRGVPKEDHGSRDWYDIWYPNLAPSADTLALARSAQTDADWAHFFRRYRKEMALPDARHSIGLLAAMSQHSNLSVGCYCTDETRCHRSVLRALLLDCGARLVDEPG